MGAEASKIVMEKDHTTITVGSKHTKNMSKNQFFILNHKKLKRCGGGLSWSSLFSMSYPSDPGLMQDFVKCVNSLFKILIENSAC